MPGIQLGNFVTTTTRNQFFPKCVDNVFTGNVLWNQLRGSARPWTGGTRLAISTTVANRTGAQSFSGFDTLPTNQENVRQQFTIDPSEYTIQAVFSGIQLAVNKGPEAYLNIIATEFEDISRNLAEKLGADAYLDGTGNANKDIAGLNYHVDDATDVVTYQGLSRNTYTNLRATRNAQGGALGFSNLAADYDAAQRGNDAPTLIVTTPTVFSIVERLVTPTSLNINYNQSLPTGSPTGGTEGIRLNHGANSFYYRGIPVVADEMCTSGNIWTLNMKHLFLYELDYPADLVEATKEGFAWSGFKKSTNQNALVGHLYWAGQLVGDSPRTMARRTAVTS